MIPFRDLTNIQTDVKNQKFAADLSDETDDSSIDDDFVRKPKKIHAVKKAKKRPAADLLLDDADDVPRKRKTPSCRLSESALEALVTEAEQKSKSFMEEFKEIYEILPSLFDFIIISMERNSDNPEQWKGALRLNISCQKEAELWIEEFEMLSSSDFRQKETRLKDSPQVVFKRLMRCQFRVPKSNYQPKKSYRGKKPMKRVSKNTDCSACLTVTVKKKEMKWSTDSLLSKYPCEIKISFEHNHFIITKDSLRHRRPCPKVAEKFRLLFEHGHSPSSALVSHKFDLHVESGEAYFVNSADRSKSPDVKWAFREYYKIYRKCYGAPRGDEMLASLEDFINKYNESQQDKCVAFQVLNGKDLIIAICTPLMKRVHERLRSAGEVMFVDSSGTMDTHNTRVFLLLCPSIAGALPLGVLMVSSEAEVVLKPALDLFMSLLSDDAFGGRGKKGPKIIMTDDCDSERNALRSIFPEAILLLCLFHVLNAYWRYVWKSEHHVKKDDRADVYFAFRQVVYASDVEAFKALWEEMLNMPSVKNNACVKEHLEKFKPRATEWALHLRKDLLTRGHDTNNYAEATMLIMKEKVCNRTKAFSPVQLLDFILVRFVSYLERRIIDTINDRVVNYTRSRYFIEPEKLEPLICSSLNKPHLYHVKNSLKHTDYVVNMLDEVCTCPVGKNGAPCKHQAAVAKKFKVQCTQILNCQDPKAKQDLLYIVYGKSAKVPENWFAGLKLKGEGSVRNEEVVDAMMDAVSSEDNLFYTNGTSSQTRPEQQLYHPDEINDLSINMRAMVESWIENLKTRPEVFVEACSALLKHSQIMCKSDAALVSAMFMFGKTSGSSSRSGSVNGVKRIPVQPLSVARRTAYLGGRNAQLTGRPSAAMQQNVNEHNFAATKQPASQPTWAVPPSRLPRAQAPHSLSTCVERRVQVGKTHAKK